MTGRGRGIRAKRLEAPRPRRFLSNPEGRAVKEITFPSGNNAIDLLEEICVSLHSHSLKVEKVLHLSQLMKQQSDSLEDNYSDHLDNVFNNLRTALMEYDLNPVIRISLLELVELRAHKWHFDLLTDTYYKKKAKEITRVQQQYRPVKKNIPLKEMSRRECKTKELSETVELATIIESPMEENNSQAQRIKASNRIRYAKDIKCMQENQDCPSDFISLKADLKITRECPNVAINQVDNEPDSTGCKPVAKSQTRGIKHTSDTRVKTHTFQMMRGAGDCYRKHPNGSPVENKYLTAKAKPVAAFRQDTVSLRQISKEEGKSDDVDMINIAPEYIWNQNFPKMIEFVAACTVTDIKFYYSSPSHKHLVLAIKGLPANRVNAMELIVERLKDSSFSKRDTYSKHTQGKSAGGRNPANLRRCISEIAPYPVKTDLPDNTNTDGGKYSDSPDDSSNSDDIMEPKIPCVKHVSDKPYNSRGLVAYRLSYPKKHLGRIIGIRGSRVKKIEQISDTRISLERETQGDECIITVCGPCEDNVRSATMLIEITAAENKTPGKEDLSSRRTASFSSEDNDKGGSLTIQLHRSTSLSGHKTTRRSVHWSNEKDYDENQNHVQQKAEDMPSNAKNHSNNVRSKTPPKFGRGLSDPGPRVETRGLVQYDDIDWDDLEVQFSRAISVVKNSQENDLKVDHTNKGIDRSNIPSKLPKVKNGSDSAVDRMNHGASTGKPKSDNVPVLTKDLPVEITEEQPNSQENEETDLEKIVTCVRSFSDDLLLNDDDDNSLMKELDKLSDEVKAVSKLVNQVKSPNIIGGINMLSIDGTKRNTSTPFAPRIPPNLSTQGMSPLSTIDDSKHAQSGEFSQDTLNRCLLGSQDGDMSDIGSQTSDRHTSRDESSPSLFLRSGRHSFCMNSSKERVRDGTKSWHDPHCASHDSIDLEGLVRGSQEGYSSSSGRWLSSSFGETDSNSSIPYDMSISSEAAEGFGRPPRNNIVTDNRMKRIVQFDSLGHILPPNVTREPIGPLTKSFVIVKIEESNIKLAKIALRRQQYRATSERYHAKLLEKDANSREKTMIQYGANFLLACSKSPLAQIAPPYWKEKCKHIDACRPAVTSYFDAVHYSPPAGYVKKTNMK